MAKRQKRYRGHYCWCCARIRPNEHFSGKGHARHLCKACTRLGAEELAYRQALRNLERCVGMGPLIPRKHRAQLNRFLTHQDPRIREAAREMAALDAQTRAEWREKRQWEQGLADAMVETLSEMEVDTDRDGDPLDDDELPF